MAVTRRRPTDPNRTFDVANQQPTYNQGYGTQTPPGSDPVPPPPPSGGGIPPNDWPGKPPTPPPVVGSQGKKPGEWVGSHYVGPAQPYAQAPQTAARPGNAGPASAGNPYGYTPTDFGGGDPAQQQRQIDDAMRAGVPPGFNQGKWGDPAHQTIKYKAGRILAGGGSIGDVLALPEFKGWTQISEDKIKAPDGAVFDLWYDVGGKAQRVQWTQVAGPGGAPMQAPAPPPQPNLNSPSDSTLGSWDDFFGTLGSGQSSSYPAPGGGKSGIGGSVPDDGSWQNAWVTGERNLGRNAGGSLGAIDPATGRNYADANLPATRGGVSAATSPVGQPGMAGNVGQDWLSQILGGGLGSLIGNEGATGFGQDVNATLADVIRNSAGGPNTARMNSRLETLRENAGLAQRAMANDARGSLASRGLAAVPGQESGAENEAMTRISERIAPQFAQGLRDAQIEESQLADSRLMGALGLATGQSQAQGSNMLGAINAGTNRQTALSDIALGTLDRNIVWNKFLAEYGLDRARLANEIQNGRIENLQHILELFAAYVEKSRQGQVAPRG